MKKNMYMFLVTVVFGVIGYLSENVFNIIDPVFFYILGFVLGMIIMSIIMWE